MSDYDPIGTVAFFRERHRCECANTARVLKALPPGNLAHAPHPQSSTAGTTAWTIVRCLRACLDLLHAPCVIVSHEEHPDHAALLAEFHALANAMDQALSKIEESDWIQERALKSNATVLRLPLGQILWMFHVDAIHHRAQISTYLRPLGATVPSIYGPCGDEPGLPH